MPDSRHRVPGLGCEFREPAVLKTVQGQAAGLTKDQRNAFVAA
ncbi:hypothetical protein [Streptomyces sp. AK010]|nr:hypothetical protein [Streptomyces sp. AK010]MBB6418011.1 hypothetical protein [Streptomyces sp. AK010]